MKRNAYSLLSDGGFLLLLVVSFVCIVFMAGEPDRYLQNIIFLNVAFLIAILTYFTNVTTGLLLNILFIFGYGTYTLYQTVVAGNVVDAGNYFWLLLTPAFTAVTWMMTQSSKQLQVENAQLKKSNESLGTLDENTNLKNSKLFQTDASIFMALSSRYNIPLTLLVVNVKYWDELKRMINEDEITNAIYDVSVLSRESIRGNDSLYMLDRDNPTWGLLLFTDREGAVVVIERLKQKVMLFNNVENPNKYKIELNLRIGAAQYEPEEFNTPLEFIVQARRQLEYDV